MGVKGGGWPSSRWEESRSWRVLRLVVIVLLLTPMLLLLWFATAPLRDLWAKHSMADAVRGLPFVTEAVVVEGHDATEIYIELDEGADDADAKRVYCDVVIPAGWVHYTYVERGDDYWQAPEDCHDPNDVPAAETG